MTFSPTECKRLLELRKRAMTTGPWLCPAHRGEGSARTVEDTSGRRIVNCFPDQIDAGGPTLNELKELAKHRAAFIASAHSLADQLEAAIGVIERIRAETLEEAAKVCLQVPKSYCGKSIELEDTVILWCQTCAHAIRNLLAEGKAKKPVDYVKRGDVFRYVDHEGKEHAEMCTKSGVRGKDAVIKKFPDPDL